MIETIKKIVKYLTDKDLLYVFLAYRNLVINDTDEKFLYHKFKISHGYYPDLKNPKTFNEKLQWLKLNDRKDEYTTMVDKYEAKKYVANKIGEQYIVPLYGVWEKFEDIDFSKLPQRYVLKTTHDCGGVIVVDENNPLDIESAKNKIEKSLKTNYFIYGREWPYKNVKPRIIAEENIADEKGMVPTDYKIMCFNGKVKCSFTVTNRFGEGDIYVNFYDRQWQPMPFERHYKRNPIEIEKPQTYEKMIELAEILSENIPFVRVDFYEKEGKILFGELTFFPGGGMEEFSPIEWDRKLGDWIVLPK